MKSMVPEIRFKGFNDKLELHRFDELFKISQGLQIPINKRYTKPGKNRYFYITNEFIKNNCETSYFIDSPSTSVICEKDDILMTRTGNTGVVVTDIEGCFHNNFFKIKYDKENLSKKYICYLLSTNKMHNIILNSAGSSTIPDLSHKAFYEIEGYFAKDIKEQKKIGDFLSCIDKMIDDVVSKLDKLKEIKKTMLYKMFPQNGIKIPEIRLKGFEGEWEVDYLSKRVAYYNGLTYSPKDVVENNGTLVLRSSNVQNSQIILEDNVFVKNDVVNVVNVKVNDIIIVVRNGSRQLIGKHAIIKKEMNNTVIGAFMTGIRSKNANFINALLSISNFERQVNENMGATINQITAGMFDNMIFLFPGEDEQQAIGEYFSKIDNIIDEYTQKITKLKKLKKTLLNKMFV